MPASQFSPTEVGAGAVKAGNEEKKKKKMWPSRLRAKARRHERRKETALAKLAAAAQAVDAEVVAVVAAAEGVADAVKALNPEAPVFIPNVPVATFNLFDLPAESKVNIIDQIPTYLINPVQGESPTVIQQFDPDIGQFRFFLQTPITVEFMYDTPVCRIDV